MDLQAVAQDTLQRNDRGGYTTPSPRLYPYQWLWDAGFIALGIATYDEARAWEELRSLLSAQWPDGMVPHIVFHRSSPDYFPGPNFWGAPGPQPSSGITQPEVLATVVRRLLTRAADQALAEEQARALYPRLLAFHRWFGRARDPQGSGLVAVLHPWESGLDNSPLWDRALARVRRLPLPAARRDTSHVGADERPRNEEYERYLSLVSTFREAGYAADKLYALSPFRVTSVSFNAILCRAHADLLELAQRFSPGDAREIKGWLDTRRAALQTLWSEDDAFYYSRDLIRGEPIQLRTFEGFMPLYAGSATREQAEVLAGVLEDWMKRVNYILPSVDPSGTAYEPRRYWRGPIWINVNWMLSQGLASYGYMDLAERLRSDSFALAELSGIREYYHPKTGEGLGGEHFAWTAALLLDWMKTGSD